MWLKPIKKVIISGIVFLYVVISGVVFLCVVISGVVFSSVVFSSVVFSCVVTDYFSFSSDNYFFHAHSKDGGTFLVLFQCLPLIYSCREIVCFEIDHDRDVQ